MGPISSPDRLGGYPEAVQPEGTSVARRESHEDARRRKRRRLKQDEADDELEVDTFEHVAEDEPQS